MLTKDHETPDLNSSKTTPKIGCISILLYEINLANILPIANLRKWSTNILVEKYHRQNFIVQKTTLLKLC